MKIKEIPDPQTGCKGSQCQHQYTQKVSTGCRLQAAGYRPEAAGCKLLATGCRRGASGLLGVSGYKPGAAGGRLQATGCRRQGSHKGPSCRQQATGYTPHATDNIIYVLHSQDHLIIFFMCVMLFLGMATPAEPTKLKMKFKRS